MEGTQVHGLESVPEDAALQTRDGEGGGLPDRKTFHLTGLKGGPSMELAPGSDGEGEGAPHSPGGSRPATADGQPGEDAAAAAKEEEEMDLAALKGIVAGINSETQAILFLQKKRQQRFAADKLEVVRREVEARLEGLIEQETRFLERQKALQEMMGGFKLFIEENDSKRAHAGLREKTEAQQVSKLEADIARLSVDLERMRKEKIEIEAEVDLLRRYAEYMNTFVVAAANGGSTDKFERPLDVIDRYNTLKATNQDMHTQADRAASQAEEVKAALNSMQSRSRDLAMVGSSATQAGVIKLEEARSVTADLTAQVEFGLADEVRERCTTGVTETAVRNLYGRVMGTAPPTAFHPVSTALPTPSFLDAALRVIGERIVDLNAIVAEYAGWKAEMAAAAAAAAESGPGGLPPVARGAKGRRAAGSGVAAVRAAVAAAAATGTKAAGAPGGGGGGGLAASSSNLGGGASGSQLAASSAMFSSGGGGVQASSANPFMAGATGMANVFQVGAVIPAGIGEAAGGGGLGSTKSGGGGGLPGLGASAKAGGASLGATKRGGASLKR